MTVRMTSSFQAQVAWENRTLDNALEFKSGAVYNGDHHENVKEGFGVFTWPNGDKYEGSFKGNKRHGKGEQIWADGDRYCGFYIDDLRHGKGIYHWNNQDTYIGHYYKDHRHGYGKYKWKDGSYYLGTFYLDKKEGYGMFQYANGDCFKGLYKDDDREGPGIQTYASGNADVGFWRRDHLIKLICPSEISFTMNNHKEFEYDPSLNEIVLKVNMSDDPLQELLIHVVAELPNEDDFSLIETNSLLNHSANENERDMESTKSIVNNAELKNRSATSSVGPQNFERESTISNHQQQEMSENQSLTVSQRSLMLAAWKTAESHKFVATNNTPAMMAMQTHVHRFEATQSTLTWDIKGLLNGQRDKFPDKGPLELAALEFLAAAINDNFGRVKTLLDSNVVNPNLADCNGCTALLGSVINWNLDIINLLLDSGADINVLTNEGVSALTAAMIYYYPTEKFCLNIAETPPRPVTTEEITGTKTRKKRILAGDTNLSKSGPVPDNSQVDNVEKGLGDAEVVNKKSENPSKFTGALSQGHRPEFTIKSEIWHYEQDDLQKFEDMSQSDLNSKFGTDNFTSLGSLAGYRISVPEALMERCATHLSHNEMVVSKARLSSAPGTSVNGKVRDLAIEISRRDLMDATIQLLLRRGANPNASLIPMSVLFFAVKAMDVKMVRELLLRGVDTKAVLFNKSGLSALHIAVALPGEAGVLITQLLLNSLAFPDVRASPDDTYLNRNLEEEWSKDVITDEQLKILGGRTPLHIACSRSDNYKSAHKIVRLLLNHHANVNLLCNGQSPLSLAIASGNDFVIDELLSKGADSSLVLTHGIGSALCAASSIEHEERRSLEGRLHLLNKLMKMGANILAPIALGPKRVIGTAVDYAYYMYNTDKHIANVPYHALTLPERETYNARRRILTHIGNILREKAVERERLRLEDQDRKGLASRGPSPGFVYTGAGAQLPKNSTVSFGQMEGAEYLRQHAELNYRRAIFKYCYECGRSVFVRLAACTRCKEVYYCSKNCKLKAWNARHQDECIRVGGRVESSKVRGNRIDSATAATDPEKNWKKPTVPNLMGEKQPVARPKKALGDRRTKSAAIEQPNSKFGAVKFPPLQNKDHPAYSFQFINGEYVKMNLKGNIIVNDPVFGNYSFN